MKLKTLVVCIAVGLVTGCGAEWFPEGGVPASSGASSTSVESSDAGTFVSADRNTDKTYITQTTRGKFLTYSTLAVAVATPVAMEKHYDSKTKLLLGELLRASEKTVLIKQVLSAP